MRVPVLLLYLSLSQPWHHTGIRAEPPSSTFGALAHRSPTRDPALMPAISDVMLDTSIARPGSTRHKGPRPFPISTAIASALQSMTLIT